MFDKNYRRLALISTALLAGCSFRTQTTGMAVEYNDFVAQTTNRQTLLNVLRAREREPMHFTSFGLVRGTVRGQANAEASAGIPSDAVQTIAKTITPAASPSTDEDTVTKTDNAFGPSLKAGLQVSSGTDFDIAVNATDEFYRGILGPLKESVVVHYLRQGFPPDLLSHLVIGEIRFHAVFTKKKLGANGKVIDEPGEEIDKAGQVWKPGPDKYGHVLVHTIRNTPDEVEHVEAFKQAMDCRQLAYVTDRRDKRGIGFKTLSELSSVAPETLGRVEGPQGEAYTFKISESTDFRLALSEPGKCDKIRNTLKSEAGDEISKLKKDLKKAGIVPLAPVPDGAGGTEKEPGAPDQSALTQKYLDERTERSDLSPSDRMSGGGTYEFETKDFFQVVVEAQGLYGYSGDLVIEVTLRSVEGILYYLGEYIRKPLISPMLYGETCPRKTGLPPPRDTSVPCIPILVVDSARDARGEAFADVSYRRTRYVVPLSGQVIGTEAGRSSQTISLVQQLLNLHRSSKDLPVTPVVRVAN